MANTQKGAELAQSARTRAWALFHKRASEALDEAGVTAGMPPELEPIIDMAIGCGIEAMVDTMRETLP